MRRQRARRAAVWQTVDLVYEVYAQGEGQDQEGQGHYQGAAMNDQNDDLVETLEQIIEEGEWALAADWSLENLRERIGGMVSQARYGVELAKDLAFERA
jgi:ElaB/YqjD/DUF883 family membrane-anchored ribosome-binding protein